MNAPSPSRRAPRAYPPDREIRRALDAARAAGLNPAGFTIGRTGEITVFEQAPHAAEPAPADDAPDPARAALDARRRRKAGEPGRG
ncbi:MAG: hypothetical protein ABL308_12870 [Oceanicaulis sp.]